MNHVDSDLEEGEIPDDSPSSPPVTDKKDRDLPRRYILRENKSAHKHKRDCKYAIRYHAKKLSKLKKSPARVSNTRKHRQSCPRDKSKYNNSPVSDHLNKNSHSFSKHSLISEINCSFKDLLLKKQNSHTTSSPKAPPTTKTKSPNLSIPEIEKVSKNDEPEIITITHDDSSAQQECCGENLSHLKELSDSSKRTDAAIVCSKAESDESEDEEELRRIALATCAKRKLPENQSQIVDSSLSVPEPSAAEAQIITNNLVSDNYEVVDMEVDDDDAVESLENECLFIIDTKPSSDSVKNVKQVQNKDHNSDDDFEADILRAELIGSLFRKRALQENKSEDPKPNNIIQHPNVPINKISVPDPKSRVNMRHKPLQHIKRPLQPVKRPLQQVKRPIQPVKRTFQPVKRPVQQVKRPVQQVKRTFGKNSLVVKKCNKLAPSSQINKSPKRLIISLNGESSSEESDNAEASTADNPVASIEALISDCRQNSNLTDKSPDVPVPDIPEALSCLSKAQQEEYNTLVKYLAEKKKPASQQPMLPQNDTAVSVARDKKFLEDKIAKFEETLQKEKLSMTTISKNVDEKKKTYMKSKLSAQLLKEQYVAAEKVRRQKLDEWSKSCKKFEVVKKSVSGLESKILQLQNIYSRLDSSVQGQISSLPMSNGHL